MRSLRLRPAVADTALPVIGASASAETLAVYRWLRSLKGRAECAWLPMDRHEVVAPMGAMKGARTAWQTQTGEVPVGVGVEYHDSAWTTGAAWLSGGAGPAAVAAEIQAAVTAGAKFVCVHAHMGNPVTGALSRQGQDGTQSAATGYQQDRSGTPMAAIKNGGAQYGQFTGWLDRFATWAAAQTFPVGHAHAGAKIPIVLRLFHECSGSSFWWAGSDRAADHVTVWTEAVAYLKAKPVSNVLFAVCYDTANAGALTSWSSWWPGSSVADIAAFTRYDDSAAPASLTDAGGLMTAAYSALQAVAPTSILAVMESGYANDDSANLWDARFASPFTSIYPALSMVCTWRPDPSTVKWGPGSLDSAARKASAANAVRNRNVMTAGRCGL